jgi:hypothetical protein
MLRQLSLLALAALLASPMQAAALTFVRAASASFLGQPLDFSVEVQGDEHENLTASCLSVEVLVDGNRLPAGTVRVAIEPAASPAARTVRVVSSSPIDQPSVNVNLTGACPTRTTQTFVVLVNPPPSADAQPTPAAEAASDAPRPSLASGVQAAQRVIEHERLATLEESLAALRAEKQETEATLALLQARAAELRSESSQFESALTVVCLALACAIGALIWKWHPVGRAQSRAPDTAGTDSERASQVDTERSDTLPETGRQPPAGEGTEPTTRPMMLAQARERPVSDFPRQADAPAREMTVEELIDLEQQVEFFLVLGQLDDAVDRLSGLVDSGNCVSPLPYLNLLDILHRRGDRKAHQRLGERFKARFNTPAPEWTPEPLPGLGADADPSLVARLQALWPTHGRAMETLAGWLLRRDPSGPIFELSTYRDLLHLYSVARDLSERERSSRGVDVLLPMDSSATGTLPWSRAVPTRAGRAPPGRDAATEVDIILP